MEAIKLHRDKDTGKSKGFAFMRYEDPKSCILAVDNFNGASILNRKISVNHVKDYKHPEEMDLVADQGRDSSSEDEKTKRDRRKKDRREEARNIELMRAAMSQSGEDRERAIEKERSREERRRDRSERGEEREHRSKRPKYESYEPDSSHGYRDC